MTGAQIVGRAFVRAVRQEINASQQAAQARGASQSDGRKQAAADAITGMTIQVGGMSFEHVSN